MKQKLPLVAITTLLLFGNLALNHGGSNSMNANTKTDIIRTVVSSFITSFVSSMSSSSDGNGTCYFKTPEWDGERDCGSQIIKHFRTVMVKQADGTMKTEYIYLDSDIIKCGKIIHEANVKGDHTEELKTEEKGKAYVKCEEYGVGTCVPRSLSCEEQGYECN